MFKPQTMIKVIRLDHMDATNLDMRILLGKQIRTDKELFAKFARFAVHGNIFGARFFFF